jgi:hypothetical protein
MPLPVLPPTADPRTNAERTNVLIRNYNREDTRIPIYAADTGSATAYAIAPIPGITFYTVGQIFTFAAAHANSGAAPTLAVNGLSPGTITYPDGSALVPGDIAANGLTMVQVASTTPTFHLLSSAGGRSKLLQIASTQTGAVATGTTTIPVDDSIPQSTEGDQYMSLAVTPKSAASNLVVEVTIVLAHSTATQHMVAALFRDSIANALASAAHILNGTAGGQPLTIKFHSVVASGAATATTFKVRAGAGSAGTTTFNGALGGRLFGGVMASSIIVLEYLP